MDKSLLRHSGERYWTLETIREYASEQLGDDEEVRRRHAKYFVALSERAQPELQRGGQALWLERLDRDHDNIRAALEWAHRTTRVDIALRLAVAVWRF